MEKVEPLALQVSNETTLYYTGPRLDKGAMPALFYFALSGLDSLGKDPYNQVVQFLPSTDIRIFSLTLPFHEAPLRPQDALKSWAEEFAKGNDPLSPFFDKVEESLTYLIQEKVINEEKIAVAGLSRGCLIAMFAAYRISSFRHLLFFAPLTDLSKAVDFSSILDHPLIKTYESHKLVSSLYDRQYKIFIGNHDELVSTRRCFDLVDQLVTEAISHGIRTPPIELTLFPSIGYKGHGTPPEIFKAGADWLADILLL